MKIVVKFFATHREIIGKNELELELENGIDINGLLKLLIAKYPDLAKLEQSTIISLNHNYAPDDQLIQDGDEVALFPPVGGG
jgi:molybdopterin converting factor subunit 1